MKTSFMPILQHYSTKNDPSAYKKLNILISKEKNLAGGLFWSKSIPLDNIE